MAPQIRITIEVAPDELRVFNDWGPHSISIREARDIERVYGKPFGKFTDDLDTGSIYAQQVLAYSLLKRENPDPKFKMDDLLDLPLTAVSVDLVCPLCGVVLQLANGQAVHPDGAEECPEEVGETGPTQGEDPVLSESIVGDALMNGSQDTSLTLVTSSASDLGSGTS